jgi:hypothetical protein
VASGRRQPGSDRGRPAIDWEQAYAYYAALPPERRSYEAVALEFGVSVRTVEKHGRLGGWRQRVRALEAQAAAELDRQLGQARTKQLADVQKLIEASFLSYAQQLRNGDVKIKAADLSRLVKLLVELWQEPLEAATAPAGPSRALAQPCAPEPSPEHKLAVLQALHDSGALDLPSESSDANQDAAEDAR